MDKTIVNQLTSGEVAKLLGRVSKADRLLLEAGLDLKDYQRVIDNPEMRDRLVRFWKAGAPAEFRATPSGATLECAWKIMGKNVIDPEKVAKHLDVAFSVEQLKQLANFPFSESALQECKDTHILVAGYPLSIMDIREKASKLFRSQDWYNDEKFATKEKVNLRWYLIRKDIIPDSINKRYQEQTALLTEDEEVPRACEMAYMIILYYRAKGIRLFEKLYARCQDVTSGGRRVLVGVFGSEGLGVSDYSAGGRDYSVGLAASRKFPQ